MTTTEDLQLGLATLLRDQTRHAHEQAENSAFVSELLAGELPLSDYAALAAQNYAIYLALEAIAPRHRDDPVAAPFLFGELTRVPSLEHDLAYLLGPDWRAEAAALQVPATAAYVEHLQRTCTDWSGGFLAHHYVRYMGDLSGGQIIRKAIERIYGEDGQKSTSFYVFEAIVKPKPFRDRYRALLDAAPVEPREQHRIAAEAVRAFELNRAVFDDLAGIGGGAGG